MNQPHEWLTQPGGIAERLAVLRDAAGLTGKELADRLGWTPSKVTKIEKGRQTPSAADLDAWARACDTPAEDEQELLTLLEEAQSAHRDWRRRLRLGQAATQASYNEMVKQSTLVRHFETVFVPGPLQTAAYARHILAESLRRHRSEVNDLDEAVNQRLLRGRWLHDAGKRFEFLLTEPVLHWRLCPPDAMHEQLDRLQTVIDLSNIRFGILPVDVELETPPEHSFVMYDDVAFVEMFVGEKEFRGEEAERYAAVMDLLWAEAETGRGARQLIVKAVDALSR